MKVITAKEISKNCVLTLESYASYWSLPVAFKQYSADQG